MPPVHSTFEPLSPRVIHLANKLNRLLRHLGLRVSRHPCAADRRRQQLMLRHDVDCVVDIGANIGQYGTLLRELGYSGRIVSYEPLPAAFAALQRRASADMKWSVCESAVGSSTEPLTLNIAANSVSSSVLSVAQRSVDAAPETRFVSRVVVPCTTLEHILGQLPAQRPMVKIDTQGYEDHVLIGGGSALEQVELLELELSLFEVYHGQPLFRAIDARLLGCGFELVSMAEGFYDPRSGELLQIDAIYTRAGRVANTAGRVTS
jgi:FkbM family methyltransferase